MNSLMKTKKALTLAEAMITVALLTIVFSIVVQVYTSSSAFVVTNNQVIDLQSRMRHALEWVAKDIRESTEYISPVEINLENQDFDIETIDSTVNYSLASSDYGYLLLRNKSPIADHINSLSVISNGHGYHLQMEVLSKGRLNSISQLSITQTVRSRNE